MGKPRWCSFIIHGGSGHEKANQTTGDLNRRQGARAGEQDGISFRRSPVPLGRALRFKPVTIGDLIREGELLEVALRELPVGARPRVRPRPTSQYPEMQCKDPCRRRL
jgi:hypothetical protein